MGLKRGNITNLQKKFAQLKEIPSELDKRVQYHAVAMGNTAVNMAPVFTGELRKAIQYSRVSSERNAKGQFVKGGLGVHTISLNFNKDDKEHPYFERAHQEMSVGRGGNAKYQPSEKSVAVAKTAGEVAGGLFMTRAFEKHTPIIEQDLTQTVAKQIRNIFR